MPVEGPDRPSWFDRFVEKIDGKRKCRTCVNKRQRLRARR